MTPAQFDAEAHAQATLTAASVLLKQGVIDREDYWCCLQVVVAKYQPITTRLKLPWELDKSTILSDV